MGIGTSVVMRRGAVRAYIDENGAEQCLGPASLIIKHTNLVIVGFVSEVANLLKLTGEMYKR